MRDKSRNTPIGGPSPAVALAGALLASALLLGVGLPSHSRAEVNKFGNRVGKEADSETGNKLGNKVILIGGKWIFRIGEHDWPHGVELMETMLRKSPQMAVHPELEIKAYPYAWPSNDALEDAAAIVLYFSGRELNPLLDADKREAFAKLMDRGVGLVALHQSFTLPVDDTSVPMKKWLGAARYGYFDRTTKPAMLRVDRSDNPITRGLKDTILVDEYFPTLEFNNSSGKITPIWTAELPIHYLHSEPVGNYEPKPYVVAWAYERDNGGRSFGFVGTHFLTSWDNPQVRKAFLNAVLWTAGVDVPASGATTETAANAGNVAEFPAGEYPRRLPEAIVSRPADYQRSETTWGEIEWYVSGPLKNSKTITVGMATIRPGLANPLHFHPNSDEVLHVLSGKIVATLGDETVVMSAGDTVSIPQGMLHMARNISKEDAKLVLTYNTGWRETIGE